MVVLRVPEPELPLVLGVVGDGYDGVVLNTGLLVSTGV